MLILRENRALQLSVVRSSWMHSHLALNVSIRLVERRFYTFKSGDNASWYLSFDLLMAVDFCC